MPHPITASVGRCTEQDGSQVPKLHAPTVATLPVRLRPWSSGSPACRAPAAGAGGRGPLQPPRPPAQPRRELVGAGRRPAPAPLRPDPEPRRDGQGLRAHERATFEEVTKAARRRSRLKAPRRQAKAENMLTAALGRLFAVAEDYPELRATENFQQLQGSSPRSSRTSSSRARSTTTPSSRTTTRSRRCRRTSSPGCSTSLRANTSRRKAPHERRRPSSSPPEPARRIVLALAAAFLLAPATASAKSYPPPTPTSWSTSSRTGRFVREVITFDFSGPFSGAYRDIPLRGGETITDVSVSEGGTVPPGANTELGGFGLPDSFGVTDSTTASASSGTTRATNERRTFTISYRFRGSPSPTTTSST